MISAVRRGKDLPSQKHASMSVD